MLEKGTKGTAISPHNDIDEKILDGMSDTMIIPGKIGYNLFDFHNVSLSEPFNCDSALKKLYPGNYYRLRTNVYKDSVVVFEAWSCRECLKHKFHGWCDENDTDEEFPLRDSNETQIGDTCSFILNDGKRGIIMSFATTYFEEDFIGTGRCSGVFMGLALFTEENKRWNLKAFNPAIGYFGMFQNPPRIHIFKFNQNNIGCYIGNMEQAGGGPDYIDAYIFGVFNNTFKIVLEKACVSRGNRQRDIWDTYLGRDSNQLTTRFPDLILITKGDYLKSGFDADDGEDTSETLGSIKKIIRHLDNFDFTIISRYTFSGESYKFVKESVETKPHKENTMAKDFKTSW
jgi:hypothetical protein